MSANEISVPHAMVPVAKHIQEQIYNKFRYKFIIHDRDIQFHIAPRTYDTVHFDHPDLDSKMFIMLLVHFKQKNLFLYWIKNRIYENTCKEKPDPNFNKYRNFIKSHPELKPDPNNNIEKPILEKIYNGEKPLSLDEINHPENYQKFPKPEVKKMEIRNFKIIDKGVLYARFDLVVPKWGPFIIHGCSWCKKDPENEWVTFPTYCLDTPEGKKYLQHCRFEDRDTHKKFEAGVLDLLKQFDELSNAPEIEEEASSELPF